VRFPLMLNHLRAQSECARAISPLQLHSILNVSPCFSESSSKQILHTASSSGISSCSFSPAHHSFTNKPSKQNKKKRKIPHKTTTTIKTFIFIISVGLTRLKCDCTTKKKTQPFFSVSYVQRWQTCLKQSLKAVTQMTHYFLLL
jgi:hypothetical protein